MLYQDEFKLQFLNSINSNDKWQERVITIPLELYKYINRCRSNKTLQYNIVKNTPDQGIYTGNRIGHHKRYTIDYIRPISENNIAWASARIIKTGIIITKFQIFITSSPCKAINGLYLYIIIWILISRYVFTSIK